MNINKISRQQIGGTIFRGSVIENMFEDNQKEDEIITEIDLLEIEDTPESILRKRNLYWCNFYNLNVNCFKNLIREL